jgi:hypothetical protein
MDDVITNALLTIGLFLVASPWYHIGKSDGRKK